MITCVVGCVCKGLIWNCKSNLNSGISCVACALACIFGGGMLDASRLCYSIVRPFIFRSPLWFPVASAATKSCSKPVDIWIACIWNGFGGTCTGSHIKFGIVLSPSVQTYKEKPSHILQKEMLAGCMKILTLLCCNSGERLVTSFKRDARLTVFIYCEVSCLRLQCK